MYKYGIGDRVKVTNNEVIQDDLRGMTGEIIDIYHYNNDYSVIQIKCDRPWNTNIRKSLHDLRMTATLPESYILPEVER